MGYQESFIRIDNLARAAGYRDAIKERQDDYSFYFYCAARAKKDMYPYPWWVGAPKSFYEKPFIREGELFAVVGGDRSPYQQGMLFTDYVAGLEEGAYEDFFEDLDDSVVEAEALNHPELRNEACIEMNKRLDWCLQED